MKTTTLIVGALVGDRARHAIAPTPVDLWGAALHLDGFPPAPHSASPGIDMV